MDVGVDPAVVSVDRVQVRRDHGLRVELSLKAGLRVLRLVTRGAEQHLADRRVRLEEADAKARDDAPGIGERAGVDVVLDGPARDDDTAATRSAVDRTGQSDGDQAPWLENIAGVLSGDRRGDLDPAAH